MATQLGVAPGEQVLLGGKALEVGPLLDSAQLSILQDMDESSILPVDFRQPRSSPPPQTPEAMLAPLKESWSALPVDSTAIISSETVAGPRRDAARGAPLRGGRRQSRRHRR